MVKDEYLIFVTTLFDAYGHGGENPYWKDLGAIIEETRDYLDFECRITQRRLFFAGDEPVLLKVHSSILERNSKILVFVFCAIDLSNVFRLPRISP